jgi:hypothetical protein
MPRPNAIASEQSAPDRVEEHRQTSKTTKKSGEIDEDTVRKNWQKFFYSLNPE